MTLTIEQWDKLEKLNAAKRLATLRKRIANGPLPMFRSDGGASVPDAMLVRNIKIGNAFHLMDLRREKLICTNTYK